MFALSWHGSVWLGAALLVWAAYRLAWASPATLEAMAPPLLILLAMVVLSELRPIVAASTWQHDGVPLSWAFVFGSLYLFGLVPALLLQAVAVLIGQLMLRREPWRVAFNIGQYSLALLAAWAVMAAFGEAGTMTAARDSFDRGDLAWVVLSWVAFHVVNLALVAATAESDRQTWWEAFTEDFWYYTFSMFAVLAVAPFVAVMAGETWQFVPLLLLPVYGIYRTAALARAQERQAMHDALTNLPNRTLFATRLTEALDAAERSGGGVAVFLLDLDRFKEVNDTLGHPAGDQLLEVVARRVLSAVRPDDLVARLGGDEFAVLLPGVRSQHLAIEVAGRIREALAEPFRLEGVLMDVDVSIGIAFSPLDGRTVEALMRRADVAMYVAKDRQTGIEVYDVALDPNSPQRLGTVTALREALDKGHLELHYQPKVSLADGTIVGTEALVRWRDPERGLVPPDLFVPLAERTGLVERITKFVLGAALAQVADWWARGLHVPVAVNVSMRDLQQPDLADLVARELDRRGLPPSALVLEVTESVLVQDPGQAVATLRELAELGVSSSLDDFGPGYSSLVMLQQLPVTEVKIDRSFVHGLDTHAGNAPMVRSIIGFAHGLGLTVVAEGVETTESWNLLRELQCDVAQGFRVAHPMPGHVATKWLMERVVPTTVTAPTA
jgi:diguanylate cyclase (GGDEF)-like protein